MSSVVETWARRDRIILSVSLVTIVVLSWAYLVDMAQGMQGMDMNMSMPMSAMQAWTSMDFVLMFIMWTVMMIAMMTPSASPMVFLFAKIDRQRQTQRNPIATSWVFLAGYLVIWAAFSAVAVLAQWGLHSAALLSPMMVSTSALLGGSLLVAAGVFQLTPLKHACLHQCRTPLGFLISEWRNGYQGAFVMGLKHGYFCTGCCWALMALLFVAGVMNLLWVAAIAGFVLVEKIAPAGHWLGKAAGILMIGWGGWMLLAVFI
jgi:predicted metal-binding membrane protein